MLPSEDQVEEQQLLGRNRSAHLPKKFQEPQELAAKLRKHFLCKRALILRFAGLTLRQPERSGLQVRALHTIASTFRSSHGNALQGVCKTIRCFRGLKMAGLLQLSIVILKVSAKELLIQVASRVQPKIQLQQPASGSPTKGTRVLRLLSLSLVF